MGEFNFQFQIFNFQFENAFRRRQKSPALRPAGAVGDMVRRENIAKLVKLSEFFRLIKSGHSKWQRRMTELLEAGLEERKQFAAIADFAVLPGGFESE